MCFTIYIQYSTSQQHLQIILVHIFRILCDSEKSIYLYYFQYNEIAYIEQCVRATMRYNLMHLTFTRFLYSLIAQKRFPSFSLFFAMKHNAKIIWTNEFSKSLSSNNQSLNKSNFAFRSKWKKRFLYLYLSTMCVYHLILVEMMTKSPVQWLKFGMNREKLILNVQIQLKFICVMRFCIRVCLMLCVICVHSHLFSSLAKNCLFHFICHVAHDIRDND